MQGHSQHCFIENIIVAHHYTDTEVKAAAAAVNAGTCLEDANLENNVFTNIGNAVKTVISILFLLHLFLDGLHINIQGLLSMDKVKDCISRLFMVRMKLGEFDPPEMNPYKKYVLMTRNKFRTERHLRQHALHIMC